MRMEIDIDPGLPAGPAQAARLQAVIDGVHQADGGAVIDAITLDTVIVTVPEIEDPAVAAPRSRSLQLSNFNPQTRAMRAAVVADNVRRLTLHHVEYRWPAAAEPAMHGLCCRNVTGLLDESPRLCATDGRLERVLVLAPESACQDKGTRP
jgi:hypothetical protein